MTHWPVSLLQVAVRRLSGSFFLTHEYLDFFFSHVTEAKTRWYIHSFSPERLLLRTVFHIGGGSESPPSVSFSASHFLCLRKVNLQNVGIFFGSKTSFIVFYNFKDTRFESHYLVKKRLELTKDIFISVIFHFFSHIDIILRRKKRSSFLDMLFLSRPGNFILAFWPRGWQDLRQSVKGQLIQYICPLSLFSLTTLFLSASPSRSVALYDPDWMFLSFACQQSL